VIWDLVTTVVNFVIETVESILGWVLSLVGLVVSLIFAIPILGRLLRWIWDGVLALVWMIVSLLDMVLGSIGIRPEKKLRLAVVMLNDENGAQLADPASLVPDLQTAIDIYREQANVRIVPSGPFKYRSGFGGKETAAADWVQGTGRGPSGKSVLDVSCDTPALGEDLWLTGSTFELMAAGGNFYGNWRRLIGYGAPIVVFAVRDVAGKIGCSLGPVSDYAVVTASQPLCIAHEIGHSCNLWHDDGTTNLMNPACGQRELKWWQVALVRGSRHVTYF
jgi:hypothetical protein